MAVPTNLARPVAAASRARITAPERSMSEMSWTDERVETLKSMWSDGKSASQIAKELGGVTRNAVIGKVHRLGLSNRVGGEHPDGRRRGAPSPSPDGRASRRRGAPPQPAAAPPRPVAKEPIPAVRPKPGRASRRRRSPRPRRSAPRRWPTSPRSPRRPAA